LVAGLEQAVVDELVEVVGGQGAADADRQGGVVAAHGLAAVDHVVVEGPAEGVAQPGEAGELLIEVVVVVVTHASILKQKILDSHP
jgi:hypothetical protein